MVVCIYVYILGERHLLFMINFTFRLKYAKIKPTKVFFYLITPVLYVNVIQLHMIIFVYV